MTNAERPLVALEPKMPCSKVKGENGRLLHARRGYGRHRMPLCYDHLHWGCAPVRMDEVQMEGSGRGQGRLAPLLIIGFSKVSLCQVSGRSLLLDWSV